MDFNDNYMHKLDAPPSSLSYWPKPIRWVPSSIEMLAAAERRLYQNVKSVITGRYVGVRGEKDRIWTVSLNEEVKSKYPVVLVHGFLAGAGVWSQNFDSLAKKRTVHAIDLLGFARSSRPKFPDNATLAELEYVQSIEEWRKKCNIDKMILCGHSFGAFLVAAYALEYPERVRHLVLVDPMGMPAKPSDRELRDNEIRLPVWVRMVASVASNFNVLASVRLAGPWGKFLVEKFRPDLGRRYGGKTGDSTAIYDYIYHANMQTPTGEAAFRTMTVPFAYAKRPLVERLPSLDSRVPMTFVYGSKSWVDHGPGYEMQAQLRTNAYVNVEVIRGAGHHVYADEPEEFNRCMDRICDTVDNNDDRFD